MHVVGKLSIFTEVFPGQVHVTVVKKDHSISHVMKKILRLLKDISPVLIELIFRQ